MSALSALGVVLVAAWMLPGLVGAQSPEQRGTRLEQISSGESLSELVLEVNRVKQEIRELRGELEVLQHRLDILGKPATPAPAAAIPAPATAVTEGAKPVATVTPPPAAGARELPPPERPTAAVPPGSVPATKAAAPLPGEEQSYQQAFERLQQSRYEQAQADFTAFLERYPAGFYADSAHYWLGEASYVQKEYPRALKAFDQLIATYPDSPKVPGALLKIGYIQDAQREPAKARETLQRLVDEYGGTTEARLAKNRLERLPK